MAVKFHFFVRFTEVSEEVCDSYNLDTPFNFDFEDAERHDGMNYGHYDAQVYDDMVPWCLAQFGPQEDGVWILRGWMFSFWTVADATAFKVRWG
jgi:hypothetical protein